MKTMLKVFSVLLALTLLLCGCNGAANGGTEGTQATEPQATEPTAITTEEDLKAALEAGGRVTLGADLQLTGEVVVAGTILDGGGYTITGPAYDENVETTQNAITVTGGTVENVTVIGKYRAIGDRKGMGANSDVRLKNVTVDGGDSYALNFGYGNGQASLFVDDSTLCGWSSYIKFQQAIFTNCTFGWSADGSNGTLRPYIDTTLIGCHFEGKVNADGTVTPFNISFKSSTEGVTLILEDCYVGDTLITAENMNELLKVTAHSNIVQVRNTAA